jgi:hypothetical protein
LDNVKEAAANVLPTAGTGTETGTVIGTFTTMFPDYTTERYSYKQWAGPTGAAVGKGAYALIEELEALEATL